MTYGVFSQRKHQTLFAIALAFSLAGLSLPWFSFNPAVTGWQWGYTRGWLAVVTGVTALVLCLKLQAGRRADLAVTGLLLCAPVWYFYQFFTWHVAFVTGQVSLRTSLQVTYPGFYVALLLSIVPVAAYWLCRKKAF